MHTFVRIAAGLALLGLAAPRGSAQSFSSSPAPRPGAAVTSAALTAAQRAAIIDSVCVAIRGTYVDADTGALIVAHLRRQQAGGAFDTLTDGRAFATVLTSALQAVNHDGHLYVQHDPPGLSEMPTFGPKGPVFPAAAMGGPGGGPAGDPADDPNSEFTKRARRANFGLHRAEILPGNIGYLDVGMFMGAPGAEHAIASALQFLANTDAIIIDVRRNGGGSGVMSHMLFSHFLGADPVPTIRVRDRLQGTDVVQESMREVPGPRRTTVPLYVLTSRRTGSAAEEFSFVLRNRQRATLIGEPTAGAGHMNMVGNVGHGFAVSVSFARVSDPVTGSEWERVGVTPHVAVAASAALDRAHEHAARTLAGTSTDTRRAAELTRIADDAGKRARSEGRAP